MLHTTTSVPAEVCHLPSWLTLYDPAEFPCLAKTSPLLFSFIFTYTTYALYLSFISLINEMWTDAELWLMCSSKQWFADVVAQLVKNMPEIQETQVQSLGRAHPLKKEMATHHFLPGNPMDRGAWGHKQSETIEHLSIYKLNFDKYIFHIKFHTITEF